MAGVEAVKEDTMRAGTWRTLSSFFGEYETNVSGRALEAGAILLGAHTPRAIAFEIGVNQFR